MKTLFLTIALTLTTIGTAFAEEEHCNTYCTEIAGSVSCNTVCSK